MRHGEMTEEEAAVHPQRHILTRALGVSAEVEADMWELALGTGDRVLLCSDGLTNEVGADEIEDILRRGRRPRGGGGAAGRVGQRARRRRQHHRGRGRRAGGRAGRRCLVQGDAARAGRRRRRSAAGHRGGRRGRAGSGGTGRAAVRPPSEPPGGSPSRPTRPPSSPPSGGTTRSRRAPASSSATSRPRWPRPGRAATSSSWARGLGAGGPLDRPGPPAARAAGSGKPPGKESRGRAGGGWASPAASRRGCGIRPPGGRGACRRLLRAQVVRVRQLDRDRAG